VISQTDDCNEGKIAWRDKRDPRFTGQ
jgi:hypothetical protein